MVVQLESMVVTVLRDAWPGERGFDKHCTDKQVVVLMPDGSTRIVPNTALTVDGEKVVADTPLQEAVVADEQPVPEDNSTDDNGAR
jgi:hypothetical protein